MSNLCKLLLTISVLGFIQQLFVTTVHASDTDNNAVIAAYEPQSHESEKIAGQARNDGAVAAVPVTWKSSPEFNGGIAGTYVFTAEIGGGFALADDAALPTIAVTVKPMGIMPLTNTWSALETAVSASGSGTVQLTGNITGATQLTIERSLTLDLNGHTLTINVPHTANGIKIASGITLTIMDSSTGGMLNVTTAAGIFPGSGNGAAINTTDGSLIIQSGTITATANADMGAGIGGGENGAVGNITITGGTITANAFWNGAGIGGGNNVSGAGGSIIISGGTVTAKGGVGAAGIGGGNTGAGGVSSITISGGTVVAEGGTHGAGIGNGQGNSVVVAINISDGTVTASGGGHGAGIGGGGGNALNGSSANITISGGTVTANGAGNGAGIGGGGSITGSGGASGTINISDGIVTAISGSGSGADIGSGGNDTTNGADDHSGITGGTVNGQNHAPFVAVSNITVTQSSKTAGTPLTLSGTVAPSTATNQIITWSVQSPGTTGATISGSTLNTTAAGTVTVRATIANGTAVGTNHTQDFNITVNAPTAPDENGSGDYWSGDYWVEDISIIVNRSTRGRLDVSGEVYGGVLSARITDDMVQDAIRTASTANGGRAIVFNITAAEEYHSIQISFDRVAFNRLNSGVSNVRSVMVGTAVIDITLDRAAIGAVINQTTGDVIVSAVREERLSNSAREIIGNRPVFGVTIRSLGGTHTGAVDKVPFL